MTKREFYTAIITGSYVSADGVTIVPTPDEMGAMAQKEIDALDHREEKARERRAAKKTESDAMTDAIFSVMTPEVQTMAEVVAAVTEAFPEIEITSGKASPRIAKLVEAGKVIRSDVKVDKRTVKGYALAE